MTQEGKCDVCRSRKVKCDEKKPKCTACLKGDRACTYRYAHRKPVAFVVEDPNEFSAYGKTKVPPLVYPLVCSERDKSDKARTIKPPTEESTDTAERLCQVPHSGLRRLPSTPACTARYPTKSVASVQCGNLVLHRPSCAESLLATRFVHMLGNDLQNSSPLLMDGVWAESIPARIGHSSVFDLSVEFALDSLTYQREPSFSAHKAAIISKGKALQALRAGLQKPLDFDVLMAIKMHSHSETFLDSTNRIDRHLHMNGLFRILKSRQTALSKDTDYWLFMLGIYIDEVIEAMYMGRRSYFDNDLFLAGSLVNPSSQSRPTINSASLSLMHCWIQIPHLASLVRRARAEKDVPTLASAVSLAESLWTSDQLVIIDKYFQSTTSIVAISAGEEISDIIPDSLHFDSAYSLILLTRYWMFHVYFCGLIQSLHIYFPAETASSLLPDIDTTLQVDVLAATHTARAFPYALSFDSSLPLIPYRMLTPLQASIGSWYRLMTHLEDRSLSLTAAYDSAEESSHSRRMIQWIMGECNRVHAEWGYQKASLQLVEKALEYSSGSPEWHGLFPQQSS